MAFLDETGVGELWNKCKDFFSKKSIYNDTEVSLGRKEGTDVGVNSFAFGYDVEASSYYSHAEGSLTTASGSNSHAEGCATKAYGNYSHAEGNYTEAGLEQSENDTRSAHAEGDYSVASGYASHAEGSSTKASGDCSHAEGTITTASGYYSHAEGHRSKASGGNSHAEGYSGTASGHCSHAEGSLTTASGDYSHAEGNSTHASGDYSHAEGYDTSTSVSAVAAHAEGSRTEASGNYSHAEGANTKASGDNSHSEGYLTKASGISSHAEGDSTEAGNYYAHAEGHRSKALGDCSHAEGEDTVAASDNQHVQGMYNVEDTDGKYAHIVGGGSSEERKNIHTLDWEGNARFAGNVENGNGVSLDGLKKEIEEIGNQGGTDDYENLNNKPSINGVELFGNLTTEQLGIIFPSDAMTTDMISQTDVNDKKKVPSSSLFNSVISNLKNLIAEKIAKTSIASTNVNDANKVPSAALLYSINSNLTAKLACSWGVGTFNSNANSIYTRICQWQKFGNICTVMIDFVPSVNFETIQIATGLPKAVFGQPMWNTLRCNSNQYTVSAYVDQNGYLYCMKGGKIATSYKGLQFYGSVTYICY